MLHLLSDEIIAGIADTCVEVPVVRAVFRATDTNSVDSHVALLAETAAFVKVFVESTSRNDDKGARLSQYTVNLIVVAASTGVVDKIVPECTDACLLRV